MTTNKMVFTLCYKMLNMNNKIIICDKCLGCGKISTYKDKKDIKCDKCKGSGRLVKKVIYKPYKSN